MTTRERTEPAHRPSARRRPPWQLLPLAGAVLAIAYPWLGGGIVWTRQIYLIAVLSLLVVGLNLSFGYAGELNLGQVAMYAAGAYTAGYVALHYTSNILVMIGAGALAALVIGLLTGIPGLRLGGWSLAMVSFFLVLLIPDVLAVLQKETGGAAGLFGIPTPTWFGTPMQFRGLYVLCLVVTVVWISVQRNLINSRHGASFMILRESPVLAGSLGIPVYRLKLSAYALGAIPAGIAGALYAALTQFLNPETFAFDVAIAILAASVLGGSASIYGAVFGAALLEIGPLRSSSFKDYALIAYGTFLIVTGVLFAQGVAGILRPYLYRFIPSARVNTVSRRVSVEHDRVIETVPGDVLHVEGVNKNFGGLQALHDVTLTARPGRITALIGPNGSGKTTLLNIISGFYKADSGSVRLGDDRLERRKPHVIARKGVARTFQTPLLPSGLTTAEVVATGRYARFKVSMISSIARLPAFWKGRNDDGRAAVQAMRLVGIEDMADRDAAALPLGTRRLVEVARAVVAEPRLVLFDEVASGLDEDDLEHLATIMRSIRDAGATVLLVEHNFRLVLDLADDIFVLAEGEVFAHGSPQEIAAHPGVLEEYLGVHAGDEGTPGVAALAHLHPEEDST